MLNGKIRHKKVAPESTIIERAHEEMVFLYMNNPHVGVINVIIFLSYWITNRLFLTIYKYWDYQFAGKREGFSVTIADVI